MSYDHLIPRTYLRSWCHSGDSIHSFSKNDLSTLIPKNINHHFGIQNYHTIKAGMPICTEEDLEIIFAPLSKYKVEYNGEMLQSLHEYNLYYQEFTNWKLYYPNGSPVPKRGRNTIHAEIKKIKIVDIDDSWRTQYEDGWNLLLKMIERIVLPEKAPVIDPFYKGKLMRFIASLDWRTETSNEYLENALKFANDKLLNMKEIELPEDVRAITNDKTFYDMFKRNYLLKQFAQFLNERGGNINKIANNYIREYPLKFFISDGDVQFLTSDNPSFVSSSYGEPMHIMAVTPKILAVVGLVRRETGKYYVEHLHDNEVLRFNTIIINHADQFVLSKKPIIHYDKRLLS